jgi:hypothetical protein
MLRAGEDCVAVRQAHDHWNATLAAEREACPGGPRDERVQSHESVGTVGLSRRHLQHLHDVARVGDRARIAAHEGVLHLAHRDGIEVPTVHVDVAKPGRQPEPGYEFLDCRGSVLLRAHSVRLMTPAFAGP